MMRCALPLMRRLSAVHAARAQRLDLAEEDVRVDHDAVADHAGLAGVQDARGDEVELELLAVAHDRVAGVVAALVADDHVGLLGEQVGDLALALVAPLGADHDRPRHGSPFSQAAGWPPFRMLRAAITPATEACTRPRVTPAPSPTAYRFCTGVCSACVELGRAE